MAIQPKNETAIKVDTISEKTGAAGVTIDGALIKDLGLNIDTITESTASAGVTVENVLIKDGAVNWGGTSGGASSAYTLAAPAISSYYTGMRVAFIANHLSTTTCTLNINALGAKTIKDCDGNAYVAGCIQSGQLIEAYYDGTDFRTTTIRTTPWTDYTPSYSGSNGLTITGTPTTNLSRYRLSGPFMSIIGYATVAVNAGGGTVVLSPPTGFSVGGSSNPVIGNAYAAAGSLSASNRKVAKLLRYSSSQIGVERPNEADYTGSTTYHVSWFGTFEV